MPAAFAPLFGKTSPARSGTVSTRVQVVSATAAAAVKAPARVTAPVSTEAPVHSAETCKTAPKVIVQKTDDVVTSIRIECPCGQVIELGCEF
jgi:hypothetical protein